jgi:hypothetical protein
LVCCTKKNLAALVTAICNILMPLFQFLFQGARAWLQATRRPGANPVKLYNQAPVVESASILDAFHSICDFDILDFFSRRQALNVVAIWYI